MGIVFQDYKLLQQQTVYDNVAYVIRTLGVSSKEVHKRVTGALKVVGLIDKMKAKPTELSGGEQQRVGIARALMQDPNLLLVDEPTASLDPKTSRQVMRLIIELVQEHKLACIINIHDVILAKQFAQRIIGLQSGLVVYEGKSEDLNTDVLTKIYGEEDWNLKKKNSNSEDSNDSEDIFSLGEK